MQTRPLSWNAAHGWRVDRRATPARPISFCTSARGPRSPTARAIANCASMFPERPCRRLQHRRPDPQRRRQRRRDRGGGAALRRDAAAARLRGGAEARSIRAPAARRSGARSQADDLAGIFVLSDGLNVNGSELVAGIAGVVGHAHSADRRARRRRRAVRANAGRRRLRAAQRHGRRRRLLRPGDPDRPRQRRRLGRVRPAPPHHPLQGQRAVRARRRAGARSLRALSRRGGRQGPAGHRRCCFRCSSAIRRSPTTTWCAPSSRSTARRAR